MKPTLSKRERKVLLEEQHNCCALCNIPFNITESPCYHADGKVFLHRGCLLLVTVFRAAEERIGEDVFIKLYDYLAREVE